MFLKVVPVGTCYLLSAQYPVHSTHHPVLYLQFVGSTINNGCLRIRRMNV